MTIQEIRESDVHSLHGEYRTSQQMLSYESGSDAPREKVSFIRRVFETQVGV